MKMKITILEDSVIELERLKNGIRKYGQQYDWDIEIIKINVRMLGWIRDYKSFSCFNGIIPYISKYG